uniref:Alternative protein LRP1 n=1 Tax=Homo sapiens TaxID=9606 RepID=L0R6J6_HUMAN|nr:alternative protein LRP1 [Homo sapiens]
MTRASSWTIRAPTPAVSTTVTAPSSACPRQRRPAPACAQPAIASGVASRPARA